MNIKQEVGCFYNGADGPHALHFNRHMPRAYKLGAPKAVHVFFYKARKGRALWVKAGKGCNIEKNEAKPPPYRAYSLRKQRVERVSSGKFVTVHKSGNNGVWAGCWGFKVVYAFYAAITGKPWAYVWLG
ncbi:hypothetical protein AA0481_2120 [Acetobacter orientalis NRIC 0481]|nr:hypothetical protein AA0481_2120 [Acetobacter orientalis NRIC 0481]